MGESARTQRLASYLIYARPMVKQSRLAAARASEDHAVRKVLEAEGFDEAGVQTVPNLLDGDHHRHIGLEQGRGDRGRNFEFPHPRSSARSYGGDCSAGMQ